MKKVIGIIGATLLAGTAAAAVSLSAAQPQPAKSNLTVGHLRPSPIASVGPAQTPAGSPLITPSPSPVIPGHIGPIPTVRPVPTITPLPQLSPTIEPLPTPGPTASALPTGGCGGCRVGTGSGAHQLGIMCPMFCME
jgi:hypothetical protein